MSALNALNGNATLEFVRLKAITGATDGNLGAHLATLEGAGYIQVEKDFVDKKPRTRVSLTRQGRRAFAAHVAFLQDLLESNSGEKP
jgi:DNA-binding MarR family transcriptional regulator